MRIIKIFFKICLVLLFVFQNIFAANTHEVNPDTTEKTIFIEKNGIVSMEAENATEIYGWGEKYNLKNRSGLTMIDQEPEEGGKLVFTIQFNKTGTYTIWALHAKSTAGYRADQANDCFAVFDDKKLSIEGGSSCHDEHAEVIGLGTHQTVLNWQSRPKTECAEDRKKKVFFNVESPGRYEFKIISRSKGYLLDKLVFVHEDNPYMPTGKGPAETR